MRDDHVDPVHPASPNLAWWSSSPEVVQLVAIRWAGITVRRRFHPAGPSAGAGRLSGVNFVIAAGRAEYRLWIWQLD
jgi:hypothetical protein